MRAFLRLLVVVALLAPVSLPGCGPEGERRPVSGTVTFEGQPLEYGSITFLSTSPPGPAGGALVRGGVFSVPAEMGLEPGVYCVSISAPKGTVPQTPAEIAVQATPVAVERIPPEYNINTRLAVVVTSGGPNHFQLALSVRR